MGSIKQQAARAAKDVAKDLGRGGIEALEREAQRQRDEACDEVLRFEHLLGSLPRRAPIRRAWLRWRLRRARARCAVIVARSHQH